MPDAALYPTLAVLGLLTIGNLVACRKLTVTLHGLEVEFRDIKARIEQLKIQIEALQAEERMDFETSEKLRDMEGRIKGVELDWENSYNKFRRIIGRTYAAKQKEMESEGTPPGKGGVVRDLFDDAVPVEPTDNSGQTLREQRDALTARTRK